MCRHVIDSSQEKWLKLFQQKRRRLLVEVIKLQNEGETDELKSRMKNTTQLLILEASLSPTFIFS